MNALEEWMLDNKLKPDTGMALLQDAGIVSDNAISAAEVAEIDIPRAIQFLNLVLDRPLI